jgi:hypothetical protein
VHNMPMLFTWILHSIPASPANPMDRPPADPLALEEEGDERGPEAQRARLTRGRRGSGCGGVRRPFTHEGETGNRIVRCGSVLEGVR